jgi:invasion protein IalB
MSNEIQNRENRNQCIMSNEIQKRKTNKYAFWLELQWRQGRARYKIQLPEALALGFDWFDGL